MYPQTVTSEWSHGSRSKRAEWEHTNVVVTPNRLILVQSKCHHVVVQHQRAKPTDQRADHFPCGATRRGDTSVSKTIMKVQVRSSDKWGSWDSFPTWGCSWGHNWAWQWYQTYQTPRDITSITIVKYIRVWPPTAAPSTVSGLAPFCWLMSHWWDHLGSLEIRRLKLPLRTNQVLLQWEIFRILKWRYCTIFQAIFCGDIPLALKNRPYIWKVPPMNRFLKWPLTTWDSMWFLQATHGRGHHSSSSGVAARACRAGETTIIDVWFFGVPARYT